ncbi:hypothetical protein METBIDRAFT_79907 [Metschnikowia bicuspidata var. bicuspidata NRRL YB-4993]|uniref:K Homology domain-containing protein n=1 Tax=Metschnikowia bicuspidata var. bicuspidata NRRL YB-4993 TaxID=869754 RepID=A0A1A0H654_9ASCO|nr:hypothetical protein METBIDRAFT_79907 [Metschnikowia bicuspidata var. bicuspidata NRRL YB-4993]OBA19398.1 hypothetical protein METBIDRAFT_79907 [Metschnikowia bicuspidata var. bicuspidata NRRL YB-4993]
MDSNLAIFSLEHTYLVNSHPGIYESSTGLWQDHLEWSRALIPYNVLDHAQENIRVIDNVSRLRLTIMNLNHNGMSETNHIKLIEPQLNNQLITISINGNEVFVNNSRTEILKTFKTVGFRKLTLASGELKAVGSNFIQHLNSIALRSNVEIMISEYETDFKGLNAKSEKDYIYILGDTINLSLAETHVQILIDTLLKNCFLDQVQIPRSMVPCLGGAGLNSLSELTHELKIKLYLPDLSHVFATHEESVSNSQISIWMTGDRIAELSMAKKSLLDFTSLVEARQTNSDKVYVQEVQVCRDKLDLISLYHQRDVFSIMLKHGTYIRKSYSLESRNQAMFVKGLTPSSVRESIMGISALSCGLYHLDITFSRVPPTADLEYYLISLINSKRTCVLIHNQYGISFLGAKREIHMLLKELVTNLKDHQYFYKALNKDMGGLQVSLKMELANDQKDFLSGKKNGKIIKILNQLGNVPKVSFLRLSNLNFIIELSVKVNSGIKSKQVVTAFDLLLRTISLIEMEFPAEMQFNIPEVFHKSLIGNGGAIIQSILKKYNVFIKFSRYGVSSDLNADSDDMMNVLNPFLFKRDSNVLIKCPMKNLRSIMFVKHEIDQLVHQCWHNRSLSFNGISVIYNTIQFRLLKSHYLLLIKEAKFNLHFVSDLEQEFSTFIDFPNSIDAFGGENSVMITIKGNDSKARLCAGKMAGYLPRSFGIDVHGEYGKLEDDVSSTNVNFRENIIIPFRLLLQTELIVELSMQVQEHGSFHRITLSSFSDQGLTMAASELSQYLREKSFLIVDHRSAAFNPIVSIDEKPLGVITNQKSNGDVRPSFLRRLLTCGRIAR